MTMCKIQTYCIYENDGVIIILHIIVQPFSRQWFANMSPRIVMTQSYMALCTGSIHMYLL